MADFWDGGSLPHPSELRGYLEDNGVPSTDIDQILAEYEEKIVGGSTTYMWTESQVNEWVERQTSRAVSRDVATTEPADPTAWTDDIIAQREQDEANLAARNEQLADQRSDVLAGQQQSYYDQMASVADSGAEYAAGLGASIALGYRTDETGAPILVDGEPIPISPLDLWEEIRGRKFNMGSLAMPYDVAEQRRRTKLGGPGSKYHEAAILSQREARASRLSDDGSQRWSGRSEKELMAGYAAPTMTSKRTLTPSEALAMLTSMDENYLTRLQQEMWEAGLYERVAGEGAIPTWGQADVATRKALNEMFIEASLTPDMTVSEMLDELANQRIGRMAAPETGPGAQAQLPDFNPEVTSGETLGQTIDEIAQNLRGEFASPEEKAKLIKTLQDKEVASQRELYDRSIADIMQGGGETGGAGGQEIDRFMAALAGKESGGDYGAVNPDSGASGKFQIMPVNWPSWATRAGLSPDAPRTPANQELVARRIMLDYYNQFGNWRDVAVAWYSGPGRDAAHLARKRYDDRPQGRYPSINDYANDVMKRFGRQGAPSPGDPGYYGGDINAPMERFDPASEAEAILKAQDPAGWEAHEFGNRAIDFYSLLSGVV
jgi:hypothetical protein